MKNKFRQAIFRAGEYYELNHEKTKAEDRLINLAVALEALFSPTDRSELRFRLSLCASVLVGRTPEERKRIYESVLEMYDRRSRLVHGMYDVDDYVQGNFVTHLECDAWAAIIRCAMLRFVTLYLRGENDRADLLTRLLQGIFDDTQAETLRLSSDFQEFLKELAAGRPTAD